jgi:ubiquinone/menaquinone biosynthesis C-methylase UbiE
MNLFDTLAGGLYDAYIERERVARVVGQLLWGSDMSAMYRSMRQIGELPPGATVLDVPCGGGVALRGLRPGQRVRYLAVDLSPAMLRRAARVASREGLRQVEWIEASAEALPLPDATADLAVAYNGLHCFAHPAAAVAEIARCVRPGGRLVGTAIVRGELPRADRLIAAFAREGSFGPGGTRGDLERWLAEAGFVDLRLEADGAVIAFAASRT